MDPIWTSDETSGSPSSSCVSASSTIPISQPPAALDESSSVTSPCDPSAGCQASTGWLAGEAGPRSPGSRLAADMYSKLVLLRTCLLSQGCTGRTTGSGIGCHELTTLCK